jgi:hypothetical protein
VSVVCASEMTEFRPRLSFTVLCIAALGEVPPDVGPEQQFGQQLDCCVGHWLILKKFLKWHDACTIPVKDACHPATVSDLHRAELGGGNTA